MAIAMTSQDKGISTASAYFTHDSRTVEKIDIGEARSILDFEVKTENICRPNGEIVEGIYNLIRTDTNTILPIGKSVGREFTPVNHTVLFDFLKDSILPNMPELSLETVATMFGGASSLIQANFGDSFMLPNDESEHRTRIIFSNPMGRGSLILGFTNIRVVCQNTLRAARKQVRCSADGFKIQHSTNVGANVQFALDSIYEKIEEAKELRSMQKVLAEKEVTDAQVKNILDAVYPLSKFEKGSVGHTRALNNRAEVMNQFEGGETAQTMTKKTAWSLFNSFTFPLFNADKVGKKLHAGTDAADVALSGLIGARADKVSDIFSKVWDETVERVAA